MSKYTITITREFGSLGRPIAHALSQKLGIEYYDRDIEMCIRDSFTADGANLSL